jgi:hypothetical protein
MDVSELQAAAHGAQEDLLLYDCARPEIVAMAASLIAKFSS